MAARKTYWEKLQDPRWQRKRLEILDANNYTCQACLSTDKTLHVHHKIYRKGANPWEYADDELECLCKDCHEVEGHWRSLLDEALVKMDSGSIEFVVGFAEGHRAVSLMLEDEIYEHPIRSHEHAWGFYVALSGACPPKESEALVQMGSVTSRDVFAINAHDWTASMVLAKREGTE